jgi:hypothetical protein
MTDKPSSPDVLRVAGRIVEITDEDENIVVSFVPVDAKPQPPHS